MNQSIETLLAYFVDGTDLSFDEYDVLVAAGLVEQITSDDAIGYVLTAEGRSRL